MKENIKQSSKSFVMLLLTILILAPGFYRNQWLAAGRDRFHEWRKYQEHMVVARLVESRESGIFSNGSLLGFGNGSADDFSAQRLELEYQVYYDEGRFQYYSAYTSNPGLQGIFFSAFDKLTTFDPVLNLSIFHAATSLFTALALGVFIYWAVMEMGVSAGLLTLAFIVSSEWMTLFGGNIYWNLWAFYLPLISTSLYLMKNSASQNFDQSKLGILLFAAMTIKCVFTGFEYITTSFIMPLIPFVYYAVRDSWGIPKFVARTMKASIGMLAGIFTGVLTLLWQIMQIKNGLPEAINTIIYALGKRTYGDPSQYIFESESLRADLLPVLLTYINGRAIRFSQILHIQKPSIEVSYLNILIVYFCFTIILLVIMGGFKSGQTNRTVILAIIAAAWVSIIAPLSWFILFKAHSFDHTHMNFIIWQMPFTLYGFSLCGYAIGLMASLIPVKKLFNWR